MSGFAGTRAEREWLAALRRIASALERLADQGPSSEIARHGEGREALQRLLHAVGEAPREARRQAGTALEDLAWELRSKEHADQGPVEVLETVATFLYESTAWK